MDLILFELEFRMDIDLILSELEFRMDIDLILSELELRMNLGGSCLHSGGSWRPGVPSLSS